MPRTSKKTYIEKLEDEVKSKQSNVSLILGALIVLVAGILISAAANFDSLSNINKIYAEEDLKLLVETLQAGPGSIEYTYVVKTLYNIYINICISIKWKI